MKKPLFRLGRLVATSEALDLLSESGHTASDLLARHVSGDYGDVCAEDKALNDEAIVNGSRILSSYSTGQGRIWIITEADRSSTCILRPEQY